MTTPAQAPGVYVTERPSGVRTIVGAGTTTAAFLGYTRTAGTEDPDQTLPPFTEAERTVPQRVRSWKEFADRYSIAGLSAELKRTQRELDQETDTEKQASLRKSVNALGRCLVLAEAVYGFFANGGTDACIVGFLNPENAVDEKTLGGDVELRTGLDGLLSVPEVAMVAVPSLWDMTAALPKEGTRPHPNEDIGRTLISRVVQHCVTMRDRLGIFEPPEGKTPSEVETFVDTGLPTSGDDAAFSTFYHPWLQTPGVDGVSRTVPPCGHIAGAWARTDTERGVFKAPANLNLRGVLDLRSPLTDGDQGRLNERGVNCLRVFPGQGMLVWGARTRSTDRDWVYLNVRRLVCFLADSIRLSSTWAVFEPNDERLWATLRHSVSSFLTDQWRQGALFGRTPEEAFLVKCDGDTNPQATIDQGKVVCDIWVAPVRPAEFVHFTITQISGQPGQAG
ncbi:phage tail sheath family protein [Streptomyces palmae]|uniref:Phage tail sheath family protein n=1 Tax=Streptomyces palmae TaxID=1701085 RepID=A0A4Z0H888_9ACTN|nr:phage tail sheath C-terminal domain-containing protein [Streptomyces palmae]TGB06950.1 phage tail sheath family protein [Streptomyces palmae]